MAAAEKLNKVCITFDELIDFVEDCKRIGIPLNTPILISQNEDMIKSNVRNVIGDQDSIIFYDWI